MAWTTFAALTAATLPELDGNFGILSNFINIPVSITGTDALALTNNSGAAAVTAYANGMSFIGVATATNTGATTAALGALAALSVYVDTGSGPQALEGGEIVQNCEVRLTYDSTLNGGAGGFHLAGGGSALENQTLTVAALNVTSYGSLGTLSVNGGASILGLPSAEYTINFGSITPNSYSLATVTLSGIHPGDAAILTLGAAQTAGIVVQPAIPAAGSVILTAFNITSNTTVAPATAPYRLSVMRYS